MSMPENVHVEVTETDCEHPEREPYSEWTAQLPGVEDGHEGRLWRCLVEGCGRGGMETRPA